MNYAIALPLPLWTKKRHSWMNSVSLGAHALKIVQVIVPAMHGARAKAVVWHKVHGALVLIMVANCTLTVSSCMKENEYPVYPEQHSEEDRPILPYSPV